MKFFVRGHLSMHQSPIRQGMRWRDTTLPDALSQDNKGAAGLRKETTCFDVSCLSVECIQIRESWSCAHGRVIAANLDVTSGTNTDESRFQFPVAMISETLPVKLEWKKGSILSKCTSGSPIQLSVQRLIFSPVPTIHKEFWRMVPIWFLTPCQTEDRKNRDVNMLWQKSIPLKVMVCFGIDYQQKITSFAVTF